MEPKTMNRKQSRTIGAVALLALFLGGAALPADEAEALIVVTMFNGTALRDEKAPGRPVTTVTIRNAELSDKRVKALASFKNLRWLDLEKCSVTDVGLKELAGLGQLQELGLGETKVTNAGLKHLAGFKRLVHLQLQKTAVTDAGLKELAALKQLRVLDLGGTKITDTGLKELAGLKQLDWLKLGETNVTDAGLKELAALKQLATLHLDGTAVTGAGFKDLVGLQNLSGLGLADTKVTDEGLKQVVRLKRINALSLNKTQVTDASIKELAGLKELFILELDGTQVTMAGLKELDGLVKRGLLPKGMMVTPPSELVRAESRRILQSLPLLKGEVRRLRLMAYEDFEWVHCATFSSDGRWIAACFDKKIEIWEAATSRSVQKFKGHTDEVWSVAISPDMKYLVSTSEDHTVRLWEVATGREILRFPNDGLWSRAVVFSPDGTMVAAEGDTIFVWQTAKGKLVRRFENPRGLMPGSPNSVFFAPDSKTVSAVGNTAENNVLRQWSIETGEMLSEKRTNGNYLQAARSAEAKRIVDFGSQPGISVIEAATGAQIRTFKPEFAPNKSAIAISPDGRRAVHASQFIQLWDVDSGKELWRVKMPYTVGSVNFSPDGKLLVSGADDGSVRIWKLPE
jgi:hypothetical protein